jgi:hypothetical protein
MADRTIGEERRRMRIGVARCGQIAGVTQTPGEIEILTQ